MTTSDRSGSAVRIEITLTGEPGGGVRRRVLEADIADVDVSTLMARFGPALPEFRTVEWHTDYLPDAAD